MYLVPTKIAYSCQYLEIRHGFIISVSTQIPNIWKSICHRSTIIKIDKEITILYLRFTSRFYRKTKTGIVYSSIVWKCGPVEEGYDFGLNYDTEGRGDDWGGDWLSCPDGWTPPGGTRPNTVWLLQVRGRPRPDPRASGS